ncbi:MAG: restriction endonuclease [Candidatus Aenigmarchaeota archaeon]|nr:restriction endonuclease [Candidatus Aenigmarchaeota archaeon]
MMVIKSDGRREPFSKEKVVATCIRAHTGEKMSKEIANYVEKNIKDGTSTQVIYRMVLDELDKRKSKSSIFLTLRDSVADLPPEAFEFYAKKILEAYGYRVEWNVIVEGEVIEHQCDLIAEKDGRKYLVECKRHFNPHRFCGLDVGLQVQARLEDVMDGFHDGKNEHDFTGAWIFTNSKFSEHAKKYALGKNIRMTGWRYDNKIALDNMIEDKKLYPVTMLKADISIKRTLVSENMLTLDDIIRNEKRLSKKGLADIISQARKLIE